MVIAVGTGQEGVELWEGRAVRMVEAADKVCAQRWRETPVEERCDVLVEVVEHPAVRSFISTYAGELTPARITESAAENGFHLSETAVLVVSVLAGWQPE